MKLLKGVASHTLLMDRVSTLAAFSEGSQSGVIPSRPAYSDGRGGALVPAEIDGC